VAIPLGKVKSFGPYGPEYEVLGAAPRGKKGEMVTVRDIRALRVDQ